MGTDLVIKKGRWGKEEVLFLKENYPSKGGGYCASFLNRGLKTVHTKAKKSGIKVISENHFNFKDRTGERFTICGGYEAEIVKYNGARESTVLLNDGTIIEGAFYNNLKIGSLRNPNHPSVYGIGYIGQGKYTSQVDGKLSKAYDRWHSLLRRSYWKGYHASEKSYKDVYVCEEWHNFQNFAKWYEENWKHYMVNWDLDKDIICPDCKYYSPETCRFVPLEVNKFFAIYNTKKTSLPLGVNMNGSGFKGEVNVGLKRTIGKTFKTLEKAVQFYKVNKEEYATTLANRWKSVLDPTVYDKLINFKVK